MILLLGGTTEGRECARVLDEAGTPFYYSTKGTLQQVENRNGIRLTGGMDREEMAEFCREHGIGLIVDAAHPFAVRLHEAAYMAAADSGTAYLRYERTFPQPDSADIMCENYDDAAEKMNRAGIRNLLALTGANTISALKGYWNTPDAEGHRKTCRFRLLGRDESFMAAKNAGFPEEMLILYDSEEPTASLIEKYTPDAIITKESGYSGGFTEKEQAAKEAGIPFFVVRRPKLPDGITTVTGKHGLRMEVEKTVPGFYPLRSGFTTGSCATAAAKAAIEALLGLRECGKGIVRFRLPDSESMRMECTVMSVNGKTATASALKHAGDDPDITDGKEIRVTVTLRDGEGITFLRGDGVGIVTLPGLGIPVGEPAINRTPREMMRRELSSLYQGGIDVTVSVPEGASLASRTFNPRLGIEGGISIIGTSGIVRPFSADAFIDAIRKEMEVAVALGAERIVMNSGAKSEKYMKALYPDLPVQAFIHYGNFIGGSLKAAGELGVGKVTLGIMMGKAVKLAAGNLDTHSKKVTMDRDFIAQTAKDAGCSDEAASVISRLTLARELWESLRPDDIGKLAARLAGMCHRHCTTAYSGELTLVLLDEEGHVRHTVQP